MEFDDLSPAELLEPQEEMNPPRDTVSEAREILTIFPHKMATQGPNFVISMRPCPLPSSA